MKGVMPFKGKEKLAEESEAKTQDEENNDADSSSSKKGLILTVLFLVLNISGLGVGGYLVYASTLGWDPPKITESAEEKKNEEQELGSERAPVLFTMEPIVTNLKGGESRTIQLQVNLEMLSAEGFTEIVMLGPKARDSVIQILNDKTVENLESLQGKLFLKDEIIVATNRILDKGVVKAVFFSKFAVK